MVLALAPWYSLQELLEVVSSIRRINFSITEARQQALERVNSLSIDPPFSRVRRFPDDKYYICEILGDWSRKFAQMKSSLSFKERDIRGATATTEHSVSFNDAQVSFWNSTTNILDQISRLDSLWSRNSFESRYDLIWVTEEGPIEE